MALPGKGTLDNHCGTALRARLTGRRLVDIRVCGVGRRRFEERWRDHFVLSQTVMMPSSFLFFSTFANDVESVSGFKTNGISGSLSYGR